MSDVPFKIGFWSDKDYHLDRMNLRQLTVAYFQYYAIVAYIAVVLVAGGVVISEVIAGRASVPGVLGAILATIFIYPVVWYLLHRYILHSRWMWKSRLTAGTWKRIHYDHHMDPDRLEILFGALHTTLPTLLVVAALPGWLIGGTGGALAGFATGVLCTCFYEFAHCVQHLGWKPRNPWLARMKRRHMEHHFHDEDGNFGITNFAWDRLFGTLYTRRDRPTKSATVFNLGYTEAAARRYPWVANRSRASRPNAGRRRRQH